MRYGFGDRELALACASHSGEPAHVALAAVDAGAGRRWTSSALECGAHWPIEPGRDGRAGALGQDRRRRCTTIARASIPASCAPAGISGIDHRGYVGADHPYQEMIREAMEEVTGADARRAEQRGIDGCSIPTYAVPLRNLATRLCQDGDRRAAFRPIARRRQSGCSPPAWPSRSTSPAPAAPICRLMQAAPGRIFVKTGAEGVYCAAVPELGLGIALKCDDGAGPRRRSR